MDLSQMCRVCRDESDCLVDLFAEASSLRRDQGQEPQLATMLKECTGCNVARADGKPQFICVECAEATRNAFRLRRQCRKSHQYFDQMLEMIKDLKSIEDRLKMETGGNDSHKPKSGVQDVEPAEPQGLEHLLVELVEMKYKSIDTQEQTNGRRSEGEEPEPDGKRTGMKRARSYSESESWSPESDCAKDDGDENWPASRKSKAKKGRDAFVCLDCNQSFMHKIHLQTHMRVHTGERPYKCSHCPRSFAQKGNLHTHMRLHTGERPYQCPQCPSRFRQIGQLRVHIRVHTGERPYKCHDCGLRFSQNNSLQKHMFVHTGVKFQPKQRRKTNKV